MKTEQQLRTEEVPYLKSLKELSGYIKDLSKGPHDYGTAVYAASMSAVAAFNFIASELGLTGFQASCADLDILRRIRRMDGPFMIVKLEDALYPQYNFEEKLRLFKENSKQWLKEESLKKLRDAKDVHPDVFEHWLDLAFPPEDERLESEEEERTFFIEKLLFLNRKEDSLEFVKNNYKEFEKFGLFDVYLHRSGGNVEDAEIAKGGGMHRFDMDVSISFSCKIGNVKVSWSEDTELSGSNGKSTYQFDWEKLLNLHNLAKGQVKEYIGEYIKKAQAAKNAEQPQK